MINLGKLNTLKILDFAPEGAYLDGGNDGEVLLPRADVPQGAEIGHDLEIFVYLDSENLLTATTKTPHAMVDEFSILKVVAVERIGAFLDWGLPKDLLLPYAEQNREIAPGDDVVVFVYLDKSNRISASMRVHRYAGKGAAAGSFTEGQVVGMAITARTDLGYNALIWDSQTDSPDTSMGVLYANEVFQDLHYAQQLNGFIKAIRPDGKIDLALTRPGHKAANDDIGPLILSRLEEADGFLPITDKSSAEDIHRLFAVSRKKFKIALGGLYKQRLIMIEKDGIRIVRA
jgi:predicted RNA-binding protein (virulence factor B family)